MSRSINTRELYRLPWNLADNGISWLEPTSQCNLACDGCYRENRVAHKPFAETLRELDVFQSQRKSDALSIAGGDPLLYPDLERTITEAKRRGYKPVVNTNGHAMTRDRMRSLKDAGLAGVTFHVDSKQGRAGKWRGKTELELCELRDELADIAHEHGIGCAFNATIYPDTMDQVVPLARWAEDRIDRVSVMVFILYRDVITDGFRYFNQDQEVHLLADEKAHVPLPKKDEARPVYNFDLERSFETRVSADEVVARLKLACPGFEPSAYLNGTEDPNSVKWLLTSRIGRPGKIHGYAGPKFQELVQTTHHLFTDRYLAYVSPQWTAAAKSTLALSLIDPKLRHAAKDFLKDALRSPWRALAQPLYFQSILIIQPIDMLPSGRMNMCDGCPDMTVHGDKLVWSCRLDEQLRYGRNLWAKPVEKRAEANKEVVMQAKSDGARLD